MKMYKLFILQSLSILRPSNVFQEFLDPKYLYMHNKEKHAFIKLECLYSTLEQQC